MKTLEMSQESNLKYVHILMVVELFDMDQFASTIISKLNLGQKLCLITWIADLFLSFVVNDNVFA